MMFTQRLLCLSFITLTSAQTCYWPNGGSQNDNRYRPCSNDTSNPLSHICCAEWDECLPNGLCYSDVGTHWRESCTLSNWEEGGCQDLCSSEAEQRKNDVRVTPCDKTNTSAWWCCGDSDACCTDTSLAKYRVDPVFVGADTSSSMPSSTTTSPTAGSSTASASATPPNDDSGSLSTGAKAGIGVGAAFGVIALIALGVFIGRRTHKKRKEIREGADYYEPTKEALPPAYRYEAPVEQGPVELAGDQIQPQEAPDHGHGR